jgi:hypothetical protein
MMNTPVPHDKWQSGGHLLIVAWMSSLGLSARLIFVEAKHPTLMDPMMPFLIGAVWLISVVALWIGRSDRPPSGSGGLPAWMVLDRLPG